jgi:hypothetical protein
MNGEQMYDIKIMSYSFEKGGLVYKVERNPYGDDIG